MYIYIYIYIYVYIYIYMHGAVPIPPTTPNLPTNIGDFAGLDSSIPLMLRGGILMSI